MNIYKIYLIKFVINLITKFIYYGQSAAEH